MTHLVLQAGAPVNWIGSHLSIAFDFVGVAVLTSLNHQFQYFVRRRASVVAGGFLMRMRSDVLDRFQARRILRQKVNRDPIDAPRQGFATRQAAMKAGVVIIQLDLPVA